MEHKYRVGSMKPAEANYRVVNENRKIRPGEYEKGVKIKVDVRGYFLPLFLNCLVRIDI